MLKYFQTRGGDKEQEKEGDSEQILIQPGQMKVKRVRKKERKREKKKEKRKDLRSSSK